MSSDKGRPLSETSRAIASWLSLKTWVKIWLFWINFIMLCSFAFMHDPVGGWVFASYATSGPLLLAILHLHKGGLTRLLGLGHIIPWTPLAVYLVMRLTSDTAGPRITNAPASETMLWWTVTVLVTLEICLMFDMFDVYRYVVNGERYVMGSAEAAALGASYRSAKL